MNFATGWKTYTVGIAAILAAALGAIPEGWTNDETAGILGMVMIVLRAITVAPAGVSINRTFSFALASFLLLGSTGLSGCSAMSADGNERLVRTCQIAQIAEAGFSPILEAKCAAAPDPLTDEYCLAGIGVRTAIQACFVAAGNGDPAGVSTALADVRDAQSKAEPPAG